MKTTQENRNISMMGAGETQNFTIDATPEMFKLLADSMYQNKPLAVLREIGANAFDAHVSAKCSDKPFDVSLPTRLKPELSIRDYGEGLSHEDVIHLYTAFGRSMKNKDNTMVGGFGIGSKSPLAYTTSFTVVSRYGKEKRMYTVFLSDKHIPTITHLHTEKTDDATGLEIIIPIEKDDVKTFVDTARKVFLHYTVKPNFIGLDKTLVDPEVLYSNSKLDFCIYKFDNTFSHTFDKVATVLMGTVAYKLDFKSIQDAITDDEATHAIHTMLHSCLVIKFPIGSLSIAASREALSYDKPTIQKIVERLHAIRKGVIKSVQDDINACKTKWEAAAKVEEAHNLFFRWSGNTFSWKGEKLSRWLEVDTTETTSSTQHHRYVMALSGETVLRLKESQLIKKPIHFTRYISLTPKSTAAIIFYDKPVQHVKARVKTLIAEKDFNPKHTILFINKYETKDIDVIKEMLGNVPEDILYNISEIEPDDEFKPVRASTKGQKRAPVFLEKLSKSGCVESVDVDVLNTKKAVYIIKRGGRYIFNDSEYSPYHLPKIKETLTTAGINLDFYIVPASRMRKHIKDNWLKVEDVLSNKQKTLSKATQKALHLRNLLDSYVPPKNVGKIHSVFKAIKTNSSMVNLGTNTQMLMTKMAPFLDIPDKKVRPDMQADMLKAVNVRHTLACLGISLKIDSEVKAVKLTDIIKLDEKCVDNYPLLRYIDIRWNLNQDIVDQIEEYIKLVNSK